MPKLDLGKTLTVRRIVAGVAAWRRQCPADSCTHMANEFRAAHAIWDFASESLVESLWTIICH